MDIDKQYRTLKPGGGYCYLALDPFKRDRLDGMKIMLRFYTNNLSNTCGHWAASSLQAAVALGRGIYCARVIRRLVRAFIADRTVLPENPYGAWRVSMLCEEGLASDIKLHLRELGDNITAAKLCEFVNGAELRARHGIEQPISVSTACRWLKVLGYRYRSEQRTQYVDGHSRKDVVFYRQEIYIPKIKSVRTFLSFCATLF